MRWFLTLILLSLSWSPGQAADPDRFINKIILPTGQTVVVAEGDFEARSLGSFSIRLYDAAPVEDQTTFFAAGLIQRRDGTIEQVELADIDADDSPEIIVSTRSVGTGSYLSAFAFSFARKKLVLRATVTDLPADADPVVALRKAMKSQRLAPR